jgi:hypothetical protein
MKSFGRKLINSFKYTLKIIYRQLVVLLIKKIYLFSQETRNRVNLSFSLNQDIKEEPDLTSKQIRNILGNGLYTIARDINVPATPIIEVRD